MTHEDSLDQLIDALLMRTERGELEWKAERPNVYSLRRDAGTVWVESRDQDGVAPFQLRLVGDRDGAVDHLLDLESATNLNRLFHAIRRRVQGGATASPLVKELLRDLAPAPA